MLMAGEAQVPERGERDHHMIKPQQLKCPIIETHRTEFTGFGVGGLGNIISFIASAM